MFARWCISTSVFLLILFGAVSQQHLAVPNQQIVLQFTDVELTSEDAKQTILIVKEQLEALGVENIQVKAQENGKLKISYYCDADISSIKNSFARTQHVVLDYQTDSPGKESSKGPRDDKRITYNLNVYEIQSASDSGWDLDGTFTLEVEAKSDRYLDPNNYFTAPNFCVKTSNNIIKVTYKIHRNISMDVGDALHSIPEVRAGPIC